LLWLGAAGALTGMLPTIRAAPAIAEQDVAADAKGGSQGTDTGGKNASVAQVMSAWRERERRVTSFRFRDLLCSWWDS